jgi:high affinity Mn2+ porin
MASTISRLLTVFKLAHREGPPLLAGIVAGLTAATGAPACAQTVPPQPAPAPVGAADPGAKPSETWAIQGQATFVDQGTFAFRSPYRGPNSLDPGTRALETADLTLYAGFRSWPGAEVWINPEIDQGFGLSNTFGVAGFPSGEAYKVGKSTPYLKLPRLFLRQTINLGGDREAVDAGLNQLAGSQSADRLVFTIGKFSVTDVFDNNQYAHDPRGDFFNWTVVDTGTFDYAADAWAYTYGAAAEWYQGRWTARAGVFNLSVAPNSPTLEDDFSQYQLVAELEERHQILRRPGKLAVTAFWTRGRMGSYADAIALAQINGQPADISAVRRYQGRFGIGLNLEQEISDDLGVFARAGVADGRVKAYEFTDVDRTVAAGLSLKGKRWGRSDDTIGAAVVVNGISKIHQQFLGAGGLGILVGDGKLPHPGAEAILETYYDLAAYGPAHVSLDYQFVDNPGYNRDRGPVSILAARLHAQF